MRFAIILFLLFLTPAAWAGPWSISIHGGAGTPPADLSPEDRAAYTAALGRILKVGELQLAAGKSAIDVVEAVVTQFEDDPLFNAGKGAVMNEQGHHELDASIMDGRTHACGAVAAVTIIKNPIQLARLVMDKTPHVLLMGPGAEELGRQQGVTIVPNSYFWTERAQKQWESYRKSVEHGTTGCVALDVQGHLAAATSTGGLINKKWGRIGDSPIIGAGTYADDATCAVSCTGIGEEFIRNAVSYDVSARMRYAGQTLATAVNAVLTQTLKPGSGGLIALGRNGQWVVQATTGGMYWGHADASGFSQVGLTSPRPH